MGGGGKILKRNSSSIVVVAEVSSCKHLIEELRRELKEFNEVRSCSSRTMVKARFSSTV